MNTVKALLISDGLPGHYRLAEGILAAIARRRSVTIERLEVRRRRFAPQRLLAPLIASGMSPGRLLRFAYGIDPATRPVADLVVSAGGNTLAANIAMASLLGVPNVFYGSLRRFDPAALTLALSSYERAGAAKNMVMTLKPSAFDPETMRPVTRPPAADHLPPAAGLLIGGDTPTIRFTNADWDSLARFVTSAHHRHGTRWTVSNSRRTPAEATRTFAALAQDASGAITRFIDVNESSSQPLTSLFDTSDLVVCTADSSSMVSEAVWARRPTVAVTPHTSHLPTAEAGYRRYLEKEGWLYSMPIDTLTPGGVAVAAAGLTPLQENPLDRLASLLAKRLPGLLPQSTY